MDDSDGLSPDVPLLNPMTIKQARQAYQDRQLSAYMSRAEQRRLEEEAREDWRAIEATEVAGAVAPKHPARSTKTKQAVVLHTAGREVVDRFGFGTGQLRLSESFETLAKPSALTSNGTPDASDEALAPKRGVKRPRSESPGERSGRQLVRPPFEAAVFKFPSAQRELDMLFRQPSDVSIPSRNTETPRFGFPEKHPRQPAARQSVHKRAFEYPSAQNQYATPPQTATDSASQAMVGGASISDLEALASIDVVFSDL